MIYRIMCTSKILANLCFTKQKIKTKNTLAKVVYSALVVKMCWKNIKKVCLNINGAQLVRLEKRTIGFKNHFQQIPVPFKIYANFERNLKTAERYEGSYLKHIKITFLVVLLTNLFLLMMNLLSQ